MNEAGQEWFDGLKAFIEECRAEQPIVERDTLSTIEEMQCRIIGGSLISWLQSHGPRMLQERTFFSKLQQWEDDPFIVFTAEQPGLVAANEILDEPGERIAFLYPQEFNQWLEEHPDPEYFWHVHNLVVFCAG